MFDFPSNSKWCYLILSKSKSREYTSTTNPIFVIKTIFL